MPDRALPEALAEEVKRLGPADIMVGIPSFRNAATKLFHKLHTTDRLMNFCSEYAHEHRFS